jgi:DNA-binding XRE family transcriptional regulator
MLNLNQEEMASKLGVSINTYNAYEKDPNKMSIDTAKKFIEVVKEKGITITLTDIFE